MIARALRSVITVSLFLTITPATSSAHNPWDHWDITLAALDSMGWKNRAAMNKVVDANIATDVPSMVVDLFFFELDVSWLFPAARSVYPDVQELADTFPENTDGTNGFHFDDLFTYTEVETRMELLEQWMFARIDSMEAAGWGEDQEVQFLLMIGLIFHAIQDFYCHSNYIQHLKEFVEGDNPDDFPTWDDLHTDPDDWWLDHPDFDPGGAKDKLKKSDSDLSSEETEGGLQTGAWEGKDEPQPDPGDPDTETTPWEHRHPDGEEKDISLELGRRASMQWLKKALDHLDAGCRDSLQAMAMTVDNTPPDHPFESFQLKSSLRTGLAAIGTFDDGSARVNYLVPNGEVGVSFADSSGTVTDFYSGHHPRPDRTVIGAPGALDSIIWAADPASRAILERDMGRIWVVKGEAASGSLAQSTFIDGTQGGTGCGAAPCWPGVRGDATAFPIGDNFNSPLGDSIVVRLGSGLRANGMGLNWRVGINARTGGSIVNGGYNPALDVPRMLYRMYDPATRTWSPFDSTELLADQVVTVGADTVIANSAYSIDWPPPDKLPSGVLPSGFTINGQSSYAALRFLPRGTKVQYTFKSVGVDGSVRYGWHEKRATRPLAIGFFDDGGDLGVARERFAQTDPSLFTFAVLPSRYPSGPAGTLLAGRTTTPLLIVDAHYLGWETGANPLVDAARGMGVRADVLRLIDAGLRRGNGLGGHEVTGPAEHLSNFHPNATEWALIDSLATWYRIMVYDTGGELPATLDDADALVLREWHDRSTGTNGGDRGLLLSGENVASRLLGMSASTNMLSLAQAAGLSSASDAWPGAGTVRYPAVDDRFSPPSAGPGLASPGTFLYPIDGGTGHRSPADDLVPLGTSGVSVSGTYPGANAAVASAVERDPLSDLDRNKILTQAFSLESIRKTGVSPKAQNFLYSGVENRMLVLAKFLGSVRAERTPAQTSQCWPCPTSLPLAGNWAALAGYQTETYGPLYPVQDPFSASTVDGGHSSPPVSVLYQNRPNPFNPSTTIPVNLSSPGRVTILILDVHGRLLRRMGIDALTAGPYEVPWYGDAQNGRRLPSGVYFYRAEFPDGTMSSRRMVMLK